MCGRQIREEKERETGNKNTIADHKTSDRAWRASGVGEKLDREAQKGTEQPHEE